MKRPDDLNELARVSAALGSDPMYIQGAGGNTSIKDGDVMWIKASGTLLADALIKDVFVPCDLPAMKESVAKGELRADKPQEFALIKDGLRPSIETSLHAVFEQRVVVHVHCIHTLAHAVQVDPVKAIGSKLDAFNWGIVPYAKPGAQLAAQVMSVAKGGANVVVLSNHGLIVAADTVNEADTLVRAVHEALRIDARPDSSISIEGLSDDWTFAPPSLSQVALDPLRLSKAVGGSLYPDHVIFCGIAAQTAEQPLPIGDTPPFLLVPGQGAAMRSDASAGAWALAQCLGDVLARVPESAKLNYLTFEQNAELLDWDAEKYRQALNV